MSQDCKPAYSRGSWKVHWSEGWERGCCHHDGVVDVNVTVLEKGEEKRTRGNAKLVDECTPMSGVAG